MATQTETRASTSTSTTTAPSSLTPHHYHIPRGPVTATLNFYQPPSDATTPYYYVEAPPPGHPQRNFDDTAHDVTIGDIRGKESTFDINTHAFGAVQGVTSAANRQTFEDDAAVKELYYPEVEKLLLEKTGAKRILLFDHTIRLSSPGANRAPVNRVHIDQTAKSVEQRVRFHLPPLEAEEALKERVRIINVWRPLNSPVTAHPLAFANSQTVPDEAMVGIEHRYPDRTGETAAVKKTEGRRGAGRLRFNACRPERNPRNARLVLSDHRNAFARPRRQCDP